MNLPQLITSNAALLDDVGVLSFDATFLHELIFTWVNVGLVAFILYALLYKPVGNMLKSRQDRISGQIDDAEAQLKDARALKAEYETKLKDIEQERADILEKARKRGADKEDEIVQAARAEAQTLKDRAMLDIEREQNKAQDEMRRQIIEVSSLMASRFVKSSMDDEAKEKLLEASISDLGDVKWPS